MLAVFAALSYSAAFVPTTLPMMICTKAMRTKEAICTNAVEELENSRFLGVDNAWYLVDAVADRHIQQYSRSFSMQSYEQLDCSGAGRYRV